MRGAAALLAALVLAASPARAQDGDPAKVTARPIERFAAGSDETRFGALEFRGGFSYRSDDRRLAGVSAFRFLAPGDDFLTVTDTGYWFAGRIRRDGAGRPVGIEDARIAPILGTDGEQQTRKGDADAEGLAIVGGDALVSFERDHRVERFANAAAPFGSRPEAVAQPIPLHELRSNGGLETIAASPADGPLRGAIVVVAERSVDANDNLFAAILPDAIFTVRREEPWAVTDGAFLPGSGDLVLLERRYQGLGRIGMRLRRIEAGAIRPGAVVDGPVLTEADFGHEIDNMEGLDAFVNERGETILAIVSDDNASFFQRNLYLEFRLLEE